MLPIVPPRPSFSVALSVFTMSDDPVASADGIEIAEVYGTL